MTPVALETLRVLHEGQPLVAATIESRAGMRMRVLNLGGIVVSLHVPDAHGRLRDVVLGFDDPVRYLDDRFYLGAIVGRYANRIGGAAFPLEGRTVRVTANQGRNHLHGGRRGFDRVVWGIEPFEDVSARGVVLTYTSPDGEEGFPGTLHTRVTYALTDDGAWEVGFDAESDRPTPVNLTQHSYFNLAGEGTVRGHTLRVEADRYLPLDAEQIPLGHLAPVDGTAFDLRRERLIGDVLDQPALAGESLDNTFVLRPDERAAGDASAGRTDAMVPAATLAHAESGLVLTVSTSEPSVHCYAARYLDGIAGKHGQRYGPHDALCLETQRFPDSPNRPDFPSTIVRPGAPLLSRTRFAFSTA